MEIDLMQDAGYVAARQAHIDAQNQHGPRSKQAKDAADAFRAAIETAYKNITGRELNLG